MAYGAGWARAMHLLERVVAGRAGDRRADVVGEGLQRLVESYNGYALRPLTIAEVRAHELLLRAKLYLDVRREHGRGSAHAENEMRGLRSLITCTLQEFE